MIVDDVCSPVDCEYNDWTEWSSCTVTCGGGVSIRSRDIKTHNLFGGTPCDGNGVEQTTCNTDACSSGKKVFWFSNPCQLAL